MPTEREQRARELLAAEFREQIDDTHADAILRGDYDDGPAMRAIAAALQAQQPGAHAVAYGCEGPTGVHFTSVDRDECVEESHRDGSRVVQLCLCATPPPTLPEGVSDEDVYAACVQWENTVNTVSAIGGSATFKDLVKSILENFLARLAARGEKGVQS